MNIEQGILNAESRLRNSLPDSKFLVLHSKFSFQERTHEFKRSEAGNPVALT